MIKIDGKLPEKINSFIKGKPVTSSKPYPVKTYEDLYKLLPELSWLNRTYKLLFRGQDKDYLNDTGESTIYPSIYRGDVTRDIIESQFGILAKASGLLTNKFASQKITGHSVVRKLRLIRWTLLQHYEVCYTPLLDLTQSLVVACSFAQLSSAKKDPYSYVYLFGIPELPEKIVYNTSQEMIIINLQGSCPPGALRPYNQEGYLVGTLDTTTDYWKKSVLDFNRRLIGKFRIPNKKSFWGYAWSKIPRRLLYPKDDQIFNLSKEVRQDLAQLYKLPRR